MEESIQVPPGCWSRLVISRAFGSGMTFLAKRALVEESARIVSTRAPELYMSQVHMRDLCFLGRPALLNMNRGLLCPDRWSSYNSGMNMFHGNSSLNYIVRYARL